MQNTLEKKEIEIHVVQTLSEKQTVELQKLKEENNKLSTDIVQLTDSLAMETNLKNEFKAALENEERFESLRTSVNHLTGMLVSKVSTELT